ncbi:MAG: bifunctional (p)ppGpp synthetase/guanosine-3',5'-bis(diphosphate) 3'-pyrophosphohydrolase [candidate division Zixibacteria bacterium]|nr:bifunctional (p)ppGpp synthetase/guanosine-3',5'-bis(diphosphate) 3'-pyrophosphohydrolase [candidate division Zixibacteria bacterium]
MNLAEFIIGVESFNANIDILLIRKGYEFSAKAHSGQYRVSRKPYLEHCLEVAFILAEQHLDSATIAAGLLHDVVEDTDVTIEKVAEEFGDEIADLVDGVTKIGELKFKSLEEEQVEYFRKMLLSMAEDIRVIIIKLADRLHNMRTLDSLDKDKQRKIASETREVYAPLAHRFGMARIKWELEDLSLKYLDPEAYDELVRKISARREDREAYIREITEPLKRELEKAGIGAEIIGRAKHFDSIYRKMKKRQKPFEEIYDLFAIRIIVDSEGECYHALGMVHTLWMPVADRFRDYIALPKSNRYQSLHTTVIGPRGKMVEIQIRTHEMHRTADYGIAAHWLYKEGRMRPDESDKQMTWLREVLEWQKDLTNPSEFLEYLKIDLFRDDIFVFTPKGELRQLPKGSTPLDFAYAVHSEVGNHCIGAKVDGRMVPLNTVLSSGQEVEVVTSPHQSPSQDWLKIVKTTRARSKIKHWLRQKRYEESVSLGKEIFERELKKQHLRPPSEPELSDLAMGLNFHDSEAMFFALGNGVASIKHILSTLAPPEKEKEVKPSVIRKFVDKARGGARGIRIGGMRNMMFRFAQCCQPVPGEEIVGYVTRGRGVSIHRSDCPNALQMLMEDERRMEVRWDVGGDQSFLVKLEVLVEDRKNMLRDITQAISDTDTNVRGAEIKGGETTASGNFIVEVKNINHLNKTIKKIKKVKGVIQVERSRGLERIEETQKDEIK